MTLDDSELRSNLAKLLFGEDADRLLAANLGTDVNLSELFGLRQLEEDLKLQDGFFESLPEEDDWSFVIKLHALIEASVTHLLTETVSKPQLRDVFSRIELSNTQSGKLAFADSLGLVDRDARRFIRTLSELRNMFAHDVSNVNIGLTQFFEQVPEDRRKGFEKAFCWNLKSGKAVDFKVGEDRYDPNALTKLFANATFSHAPKLSIWFGAMLCLSNFSRHVRLARLNVEQHKIVEELLAMLTTQSSDDFTNIE